MKEFDGICFGFAHLCIILYLQEFVNTGMLNESNSKKIHILSSFLKIFSAKIILKKF